MPCDELLILSIAFARFIHAVVCVSGENKFSGLLILQVRRTQLGCEQTLCMWLGQQEEGSRELGHQLQTLNGISSGM